MDSNIAIQLDSLLSTTSSTGLSNTIDNNYHEFYLVARFVTGLVLYPIICSFGLVGNILILVVMIRKPVMTSTDVLLAALAISDAVKLANDHRTMSRSLQV